MRPSVLHVISPRVSKMDVDCGGRGYGYATKVLNETLIPLTGVNPDDVTHSTLIQCRGEHTKEHTRIPHEVGVFCRSAHPWSTHADLVVGCGEDVFKALAPGSGSFTDWRGFIAQTTGHTPIFITHHPDEFHTNPGAERLTEWDWLKVRSIINGSYPQPLPPRIIASPDTFGDMLGWFSTASLAQWVTVDTEYVPTNKYLTMVGLLARYPDGTLRGLQIDWRTADPALKREFSRRYQALVKQVPIIFHNCRADIPVLEKHCGVTWADYTQYEDTMLAHAVLWCELPHTLEFIASIWGRYGKLKHLKDQDELLYNFGDILETDAIWHTISTSSFKHDPLAETVYRTQHLKLCPILEASITRGLRVHKARVEEARLEYESAVKQAEQLAIACAGWPININSSQQMAWYLYTIRGFDTQINKKSKTVTTDDAAIATLRMALGPPFDPEEDLTYGQALSRISAGADPILEARVLYAGAQTRLIKYLYPLYECVAQATTDKQRDEAIHLIRSGAPCRILERIHPDMLIHTQKTGRWSTVDPPIAQLPADLRDIICPDQGEVWIHWDWSSIEPRVLEGLCGSRILKRSFDEGIDLHTWTVCKLFNYEFPPNLIDPHKAPENAAWRLKYAWKGSDDPRRVFAKTGRYEMYYGGTGANAANAAALFGLDPKTLRKALDGLLSADPEYYVWRIQLESDLKRTRMIRTFMGRPRRFLKGGDKMIREGLDQPMQGAVSDIANTTVIRLHEAYATQGLQFAWSMHDSQYWHCPESVATKDFCDAIKDIAERPHLINGRWIPFPIKMDVIYSPEHGGTH